MDVNNLISSIFKKKSLWDQTDSYHHNKYILDKNWDEVAVEMKTTRDVVRAKSKTLRDTFRKEIQKKPRSRSGDDGSQTSWKSGWKYFESLVFLQDQFTSRCSGGNLPEVMSTDSIDSEVADNNTAAPDDLFENSDFPSMETPSSATTSAGVFRKRKLPSDEIGKSLIRLEERKLKMLENNQNRPPTTVDEDEAFFNSLLPHVRPLPPADKLLLRIKMQQLVYDFIKLAPQSNEFRTLQPESSNILSAPLTQQYSNPPSVASFLSGYSSEERSYENL